MSTSNGYNSNSLLALEQSLYANTSLREPVQGFSAEEPEAPEDQPNDSVEAHAFDWDEAIALQLQDATDSDSTAFSWEEDDSVDRENHYPAAFSQEDAIQYPYPMSLSWMNQEEPSQSFGLEEEEVPAYDVQAFAVEEDAPQTDDPLSYSNSLFALERSVYGIPPVELTAQSFSIEDTEPQSSEQPTSESHTFDWDEAIALEYEDDPESSVPSEAHAFDWDEAISLEYKDDSEPAAESFDGVSDSDSSQSFGIDETSDEAATAFGLFDNDNSLPFQVEAFSVDDDHIIPIQHSAGRVYGIEPNEPPPQAIAPESHAYEVEDTTEPSPMPEDSTLESVAYETDSEEDTPAIPVKATVVDFPSSPQKSADAFDFDELERAIGENHPAADKGDDRTGDDKSFAADLEAILRGEKVYEPATDTFPTAITVAQAQVAPAPAPPPQPPSPPPSQAQSVASQSASPQDIFSQMGRSMTHATAFDLGTISLQQTFNEFDDILDQQEQAHSFSEEEAEPETREGPAIAHPFDWDEDELAADIAALSASESWEPSVQFELERSDIAALIDNNPPHENELKNQYFQRLKEEAKNSFRQHYKPKVDDARISAAIDQLSASKVTAKALKDRCWTRICLGGTRQDPEALTGYHWAGYERGKARFRRVGRPTKPEDKFGVYQQKIQHKKTRKEPKVPVTFFPNTWTEQHFDDLFWHFAQRQDFDPDSRGTYAIEAALNSDQHCIGMPILFLPASNGEGVFIPIWSDPGGTESQSEAQALDEPLSDSKEMTSSSYASCWAADLDSDSAHAFALTNEWIDQNINTQLAQNSATNSPVETQNASTAYAVPSGSQQTGASCWAADLDH